MYAIRSYYELSNILNDMLQSGNILGLTTMGKVNDILPMARMTNNRQLNETIYNAIKDIPNESERSTIIHGVQNDLVRTNSNISSNVEFAINKNSVITSYSIHYTKLYECR